VKWPQNANRFCSRRCTVLWQHADAPEARRDSSRLEGWPQTNSNGYVLVHVGPEHPLANAQGYAMSTG
jgi:hypothetical protein